MKFGLIIKCVFIRLLLSSIPIIVEATNPPQFDSEIYQLTMKDGLADNIITSIFQDRDGFMWFGTLNGLSRYDGNQVKNFNAMRKPLGIDLIKEASDKKIWLLSDEEIYCFDRNTEEFIPVVSNEYIRQLKDFQVVNDSVFWVLKEKDLLCIKRKKVITDGDSKERIYFSIEKKFCNLFSGENVFAKFCFSKDCRMLYLVTLDCRLILFDIVAGKVVLNKKLQFAPKIATTAIFSDDNEYIWISMVVGGVIRFHIPTQRIEQFVYKEKDEIPLLSHTDAYDIIGMNGGSYFSVTWNGFTFFRSDGKSVSRVISQAYTNRSFPEYRNLETRMLSSYYDPNGVLWIGTRGGGVLYIDFREQFFKKSSFQHHNEIRTQLSDNEQYIWLGTFHGGIMRSEMPYSKSAQLTFSTVYNHMNTPISSATKDHDGNLWFGSLSGELIKYDLKSKEFDTYPLIVEGKYLGCDITSLLVDSKQRFWIGTNEGLFLFDRLAKVYKKVQLKFAEKETLTNVSAINEDKEHCVWLGTNLGVIKLEGDPANTLVMRKGFEERGGIGVRKVKALLASSEGDIYVGYGRGFGVIPSGGDYIAHYYTVKDGLCNDNISCIVQDANGCIWLGNVSGISRYSRHQHLFYNYYISGSNRSGMLFNQTLFWGNNKSLTYFDPDKILFDPKKDKTLIVGLEVNNRQVNIHEKVNGQVILDGNVSYLDQIELKYANRDFSLLFSNLSYSKEMQKYAYRLYPYQQAWLVTENKTASYTNLPSGNYTFEVKSIYPDNVEGKVTMIRVKVLPHWSQTWLFYLFVTICLSGILGFTANWWLRRQRRLERLLKLKHEIFVVTSERDKEKQIREERENFFTNVAHELRTPLTLISSPLQNILKHISPSDKLYDALTIMNKNSISLNKQVDQLLYVRKMEAGMVRLHLTEWNIVSLVSQLAERFKQMAIMNACEFTVELNVEHLNLWIDVEKIESVISNLLSNAFKYTPRNGKITLSLSRVEVDEKGFAMISVTDNGVGIPEKKQDVIFDLFVTNENGRKQTMTSLGVGLYIVKRTMDMHHGRVVLKSHVGEGSCFTLYIPEGNEYFLDDRCEYTNYPPEEQENTEKDVWSPTLDTVNEKVKMTRANEKSTLLVIEDNDDIKEYICSLFSQKYEVIEAANGEEGVRFAQKYTPQLIISDIMMPVMDGFECCRLLKESPKTAHIPIIMLTARAEDGDRIQSLQLGVDDYMMKPFNPDLLMERVENLLLQRKRLRSLYTKALMLKPNLDENPEEKDLFMQKVIEIIEENLSNEHFSIPLLAEKLNMSQPTLYRKIRQRTNLSILEVVRGVRMSKAAALIMERKYTLADIASRVGFDSLVAFRKHFVEQFGILPSKYGIDEKEEMK